MSKPAVNVAAEEAAFMAATSRSMNPACTSWGQNLWLVLCRAALRGTDWGAAACGVKDTVTPIEPGELPPGAATTDAPDRVPGPEIERVFGVGMDPIDWAKLDTFERGRIAREISRTWCTR
jgi:hypothetical protein